MILGDKRDLQVIPVPLTIPYLPDDLSTALGLFLIENIELGFRLAQLLLKLQM